MQTPTMKLPVDAPLPAAPAPASVRKDVVKSSNQPADKSADSFDNVLSAKVNDSKTSERETKTQGQDSQQNTDNGSVTTQPQTALPEMMVVIPPALHPTPTIVTTVPTAVEKTEGEGGAIGAIGDVVSTATGAPTGKVAVIPTAAASEPDLPQAIVDDLLPKGMSLLTPMTRAGQNAGSKSVSPNAEKSTNSQTSTVQVMNEPVLATPAQTSAAPTAVAIPTTPSEAKANEKTGNTPNSDAAKVIINTPEIGTIATEPKVQDKSAGIPAVKNPAEESANASKPSVNIVPNITADQKKDGGEAYGQQLSANAPQDQSADATSQNQTTSSTTFASILDAQSPSLRPSMDASAANGNVSPKPDTNNVFGQIVDHARLINRANNSEMVIKLKPEHLGELTMKISIAGGNISASFHSSNSEVRAIIESSLPQLRQELSNQGLKVDNVGVYTSLDHFFSGQQRETPQQGAKINLKNRKAEALAEVADAVAAPSVSTSENGVDYRI